MFKIEILILGKKKESWLLEALDQYIKRLKNNFKIKITTLTEKQLFKFLKTNNDYICLDQNGETLTSFEFSKKIFINKSYTFIIGASDGLPQEILQKSKFNISLSKLTFTYQISLLILIEQLYRSHQIRLKTPYNK